MKYDEQEIINKYDEIQLNDDHQYALASLKIKRFRKVNRIYGREIGDELIKKVRTIISSFLKKEEYVALVGINNYNILIQYRDDEHLFNRMVLIIRAIRDMEDKRFQGEVFPGVGVYKIPKEKVDFYIAQYNAELCRSQSEQSNYRNAHLEIYGVTYKDPNEHFIDPQLKIQSAMEQGYIKLYLQPKVNLKTGIVDRAEALVRWDDPEKGMIPVMDFLPNLIELGLIRNVDMYLFDIVCRKVEEWYQKYNKKIQISVNLAEGAFNYQEFFDDYVEIYNKYNVPKECIEFELLESVVLDKVDRVQEVVNQVNSFGFTCALDDFGSGFSSYHILANANLSALKIDRSLFQNGNNVKEKTIIKHIVQSAKELHMKTIAEGVETKEYVTYLKALQCDYIQGFIFYKPMSVESFEKRFIIGNEKVIF